MLSSAGRGSRSCGRGGAGLGSPYLPCGSSLRRGRRPLRSVPTHERPSRRLPRPAGTVLRAAPTRPHPHPRSSPRSAPQPFQHRAVSLRVFPPTPAIGSLGPARFGAPQPVRSPWRRTPLRRCLHSPPPRRRFPTPALGGTDTPRIAALPRAGKEKLKRGEKRVMPNSPLVKDRLSLS